MKALVQYGYGGAEVLKLEDRPVPEPKRNQVRVRVLACGVNGSDWEYIRGVPYYAKMAGGSPHGRILGSDICGVIEILGEGVDDFQPGQMIAAEALGTFGGFAEHAIIPTDRCVPVPEGMDPIDVAALPQAGAVALSGLGDHVRSGDKVLINGAGGATGPFAIQLALNAGADVTAIDCASKLDLLRDLGAHRVLDYQTEDFAAEPIRYDLILDLWGTRPVGAVRNCLKPGGTYYLVGAPMSILLGFAFFGSLLSLFSNRKSTVLLADLGAKRTPELLQMVRDGKLKPVISAVVSLEEAAQALGRMGAGELPGKLIIRP